MTFGIISGELFIGEKIASETRRRHPQDDRMYTENSTQVHEVGHENEASRVLELWRASKWDGGDEPSQSRVGVGGWGGKRIWKFFLCVLLNSGGNNNAIYFTLKQTESFSCSLELESSFPWPCSLELYLLLCGLTSVELLQMSKRSEKKESFVQVTHKTFASTLDNAN